MKKQPGILVIGSSNTDLIARVPRLPRPGETVLGGEFTTAAGGKGANQAVAAARAGGRVSFIGCVGRDQFGGQAVAALKRAGVNLRHLRRRHAASGVALICVGADGQNSIAVAPGANAQLLPADLVRARTAFQDASILLLQLETPLATVTAAIRQAAQWGLPVILNPAPAQPLRDELLRRVTLLTPNETEAEQLTGVKVANEAGARRAARALHRRGVKAVLITLGVRGALLSDGSTLELLPAFRVRVVDTTAAGDIFNGALAVGLAEGMSLPAAARFASAAAAISVTRLGAQPAVPTRREIERFLDGGR